MDHRKITAVLIAVIFIFTVIPVSAAGGSRYGYDVSRTKPAADGTYYETIIKTKGNPSGDAFSRKARNKTATSSKTMYHKTKYGKVLWYVKVTGTFIYGSGSSKCVRSSVKAVSKSKDWKIVNKSSDKYNNRAIAKATARKEKDDSGRKKGKKKGSQVRSMTVTLTCTPSGDFY